MSSYVVHVTFHLLVCTVYPVDKLRYIEIWIIYRTTFVKKDNYLSVINVVNERSH
jgi:hypothetical protein